MDDMLAEANAIALRVYWANEQPKMQADIDRLLALLQEMRAALRPEPTYAGVSG